MSLRGFSCEFLKPDPGFSVYPRFCDWPKQVRCKAREVKVYAHTANLPQRSRLPVFDNPEGFENRLLFSSADVAFTFRSRVRAAIATVVM